MFIRISNEKGAVTYSKNIIEQVIREAFTPFKANCWGGKYTGQGADAMFRLNMLDAPGVKELSWSEAGVFVKLYVIVRIGTPIRSTLEDIVNSIAREITGTLELPIDNIVVNVTAVAGSKGFLKRDITLDYNGVYSNADDDE